MVARQKRRLSPELGDALVPCGVLGDRVEEGFLVVDTPN